MNGRPSITAVCPLHGEVIPLKDRCPWSCEHVFRPGDPPARPPYVATPRGPSAVNASKTHCQRGHEFTAQNTYRAPSAPSRRHCRTCMNQRLAERYRTDEYRATSRERSRNRRAA